MKLKDFQRDVRRAAVAFGGEANNPIVGNEKRADQLTAAAVLVVNERGPDWCTAHPEEFKDAVMDKVGFWLKIVLTIASYFAGGAGIWFTLASYILPAVLHWFSQKTAMGVFGAGSNDLLGLAAEAEQFLAKEAK